ncbi:ras-related protein Rab-31-like [Zophobas morio]|uniref:ras-related protein Rab-31-like n=1 Tax=Zophobas morio TaxID=2755281 RepID=UPI003082DC41
MEITAKVVILGPSGVGKTSIPLRYIHKFFSGDISMTVGTSLLQCQLVANNITVNLQIWDTAGQERFKCLVPMFYRNANAALFVFDITSLESFQSMQGWVNELKSNLKNSVVTCVIGNKLDLSKNREVPTDVARQYAKSINARYFECSAKRDQGVGAIFDYVGHGLVELLENTTDHESGNTTKIAYSNSRNRTRNDRDKTINTKCRC